MEHVGSVIQSSIIASCYMTNISFGNVRKSSHHHCSRELAMSQRSREGRTHQR
jgi:hypothetical protein